ncbi:7-deoxyloganetic acid glucosyl transferase-like [Cornus florida]|uniref:7-deoxyloganetic acid glucosyl transferase-like n=1 Tax=Cornus florida TaxID=4283 RepID=UPI0028A24124|nr:7-deoxyloganetic acid glucosyl transferase-like [Cornus florida]
MDNQAASLPPHALIFPMPMQGHVNSMLKLAELLCLSGFHITMLISDYNYDRLQRHANIQSLFDRYPGFGFKTIPDGLPDDHPRSGVRTMEIMMSLKAVGKSLFKDLLVSTDRLSSAGHRRPLTCLIMDGVFSFAAEVCDEMEIPFIYFRTVGACSFWANFCIPNFIEAGEVPLKGKGIDLQTYKRREEMDLPVKSIPGMEGFLRRRDLPAFCRVDEVDDPGFQTISIETRRTTRARALILNSFEDLEGPILNEIRNHCPNLFSIGPLHAHLKSRLASANSSSSTSNSSGSFWEEDRGCMTWLDSQPSKSVIYVSFGSVTIMTREELLEFWYGLVNSGQRFLWVMRPDSITGKDGEHQIPVELEEGTRERGYMVGWAPQLEVLDHPAVFGFLTHSGWNSTLEGIVAGKPMICWPYFADQTINSRFVSEVWKVGLDMKDTCDRVIVAKMVKDLMEVRKDEFDERSNQMAKLAEQAVSEGGTSYNNLNRLIDFIKSMIV